MTETDESENILRGNVQKISSSTTECYRVFLMTHWQEHEWVRQHSHLSVIFIETTLKVSSGRFYFGLIVLTNSSWHHAKKKANVSLHVEAYSLLNCDYISNVTKVQWRTADVHAWLCRSDSLLSEKLRLLLHFFAVCVLSLCLYSGHTR